MAAKKNTPAKKAPARKPAKKSAAKADPEALRKPQVRILQVLAKAKKPLSRADLIAKGIEATSLGGYIGLHDEEARATQEARDGYKSLLTRKFVRYAPDQDGSGKAFYQITATGKKALARAEG